MADRYTPAGTEFKPMELDEEKEAAFRKCRGTETMGRCACGHWLVRRVAEAATALCYCLPPLTWSYAAASG